MYHTFRFPTLQVYILIKLQFLEGLIIGLLEFRVQCQNTNSYINSPSWL